jgi:mono/diheme cytochrome c family protein
MQTQSGASMETLKSGREVFVYRCTSCHTIDPVSRHPMAYWRHAVEDMASRAKLTASEHAAIVAYLSAAHEAPAH